MRESTKQWDDRSELEIQFAKLQAALSVAQSALQLAVKEYGWLNVGIEAGRALAAIDAVMKEPK